MQLDVQHSNYAGALRALVFLFFLILLTYGNTFHASWHLDDHQIITQNQHLHKIKDLNYSTIWDSLHSPVSQRIFRPVAMLSFAFNWYLGSNHVVGYHIVNLVIHLLTAFFLYLTIRNLLNAPNLKANYQEGASFIALLATVLWAIHPIQTQAVTYIVQRMASMAAMFYVFGLYCYIKARLNSSKKIRIILFLAGGLSFLLGLGSKENAVTLPIALGLIEVLFFQDLTDRRTRRICLWGLVAGSILIFLGGALIFLDGNPASLFKESSFRYFSPMQRLMTQPRVVLFYLSQIFYPIISRYSIEHDIVVSTSLLKPWSTLPGIVLVLILIGIGLSQMRKRPILSFAILFFFLNHVIESSIIPLELVFEHRNYLPSLFLFLPVAVAIKWLLDYYKKTNRSLAGILVVFVTILLILLGIGTYTRNRVWLSDRILCEDAVKKAPASGRPLHNLAWVYYERNGQYDAALNLYDQALKRRMNNTSQRSLILNNMANIYFSRGDFDKAAQLWQESVLSYPNYVATKYRLALVREKLGQTDEALVLLDQILAKRPNYLDPLILKGVILLKQRQFDEALSYFRRCLKLKPLGKMAMLNIGIGYNLLGRYERAEWFFRTLHFRYPQDRLSLMWLIETNLKAGDLADADRYTLRILHMIRINDMKSLTVTLTAADLMSPMSQKSLLNHISKTLTERTRNISEQFLKRQ